ncbi:hypothetical protein F7725_014121 [Dissostichus mawsoni]|uniref:Uncharacterized protein n=1 Tax=Dissostichus mawsoni TaxID=36200 RepID=A0A7J5YW68_DISMA|nr:hypothetical protein F7725_014121 [Dissostichus mawsoni]
MQSLFSQPERTNTRQRNTTSSLPHQVYQFEFADVRSNPPMAGLAALCLLLVFPLSHSQSSQSSQSSLQSQQEVDQDNAKVGLFVAAAVGTLALMAAVYCIYNKFYSKHQYLHTQLNDDSDVQRAGYGSLSDTPSIISVPPSLSPPPSAMPFPPLFLSSHSLRTISAKDLEKSCA